MNARDEIREFLISRRARLTPSSVGLPGYGPRRVPGLRREEVAVLAGISAPYYARLERGDMRKASYSVLEALARALRLDDAERAHLLDLARAARPAGHQEADATRVRPVLKNLIDAMTGAAAFVNNHRQDILTGNALGYTLCAPMFPGGIRATNLSRYLFLDPAAPDFFVDWDRTASDAVAGLRASAGRSPNDRVLGDLISELTATSEAFRVRWAAHNVKGQPSGVKLLQHPLVGDLALNYEQLALPSDPGLSIFTFSATPGTPAADSLGFLASWTTEQVSAPPPGR